MDELGLKRYCCRRMIMTHVDLIEKLLKYETPLPAVATHIQAQKTNFLSGTLRMVATRRSNG